VQKSCTHVARNQREALPKTRIPKPYQRISQCEPPLLKHCPKSRGCENPVSAGSTTINCYSLSSGDNGMELSHLRAFVALSETANFVRASNKLHLSPPAVFAQIRQLEEEVGGKIYERAGKSLVLTVAGQVLLRSAKRILTEHDLAFVAIRETTDVKRGLLRFGCGPHTSVRIAPHLLRAFLNIYPKVEIENIVNDHLPLLGELHEGSVDVVLSTPMDHDPEFETLPLWRHERVFVVSRKSPWARKKVVTAAELREMPFILPCARSGRDSALRILRTEIGFEPKVIMNHDQAGAIVELLNLGLGVSILPLFSVAEDIEAGRLSVLRLKECKLSDEMGLFHRRNPGLPTVVTAFVSVAKKWKTWLPIAGALSPVTSGQDIMNVR
jgi:DNA-binding transcriptional LysR family regulator